MLQKKMSSQIFGFDESVHLLNLPVHECWSLTNLDSFYQTMKEFFCHHCANHSTQRSALRAMWKLFHQTQQSFTQGVLDEATYCKFIFDIFVFRYSVSAVSNAEENTKPNNIESNFQKAKTKMHLPPQNGDATQSQLQRWMDLFDDIFGCSAGGYSLNVEFVMDELWEFLEEAASSQKIHISERSEHMARLLCFRKKYLPR